MKRLLILLLIISCQGQSDESNKEVEIPNNQLVNKELSAYCFYKLDDKYCEVNDPTIIQNWQEDKSVALSHKDIRGNLFDHKGGGPNGSEWNPSTSIYLVVNQYSENFEILLNDSEYDDKTTLISGYTWISFSQQEWEDHLMNISDEDWAVMFPNGPVNEEDFGFKNAVQPPKTGQIIKFTFIQGEQKKDYFFYAAFGE